MKIKLKNEDQFNELLIRNGFSKNQFSKLVGISSPLLVQISNGDRCPSPQTAKRIADALQVGWDEIFRIEKKEALV